MRNPILSQILLNSFGRGLAIAIIGLCGVLTVAAVPPAGAATAAGLPEPGTLIKRSDAYVPLILRGVRPDPEDPLTLRFIFDTGNTDLAIDSPQFQQDAMRNIEYFLAALTLPEDELWVNLSPNEGNRMVPRALGKTTMSRDMLAQDYLLKQLTASLTHPDEMTGRRFWAEVYARSADQLHTTAIPVNAFNKVWIVPETAVVYEDETGAWVLNRHLKVLLEQDYLATYLEANKARALATQAASENPEADEIARQVMRDVILPELEAEVNDGKNFAPVRQMYNAMILASWFKQSLRESLLGKVYMDQEKVDGIALDDPKVNKEIYEQYMAAFRKGVYSLVRAGQDPYSGAMVSRKYFSGGIDFGERPRNNLRVGPATVGTVEGREEEIVGESPEAVVRLNLLAAATIPVSNPPVVLAAGVTMEPEEALRISQASVLAALGTEGQPASTLTPEAADRLPAVSPVDERVVLAMAIVGQDRDAYNVIAEDGIIIAGQLQMFAKEGRLRVLAGLDERLRAAPLVAETGRPYIFLPRDWQVPDLVRALLAYYPKLNIPLRDKPQIEAFLQRNELNLRESLARIQRVLFLKQEGPGRILTASQWVDTLLFVEAAFTPDLAVPPAIAQRLKEVGLGRAQRSALQAQFDSPLQVLTNRRAETIPDVVKALLAGQLDAQEAAPIEGLRYVAALYVPDLGPAQIQELVNSEAFSDAQQKALESASEEQQREAVNLALAQVPQQPTTVTVAPGGIDLNRALLKMEIQRGEDGMPLPPAQQPLLEVPIDGLRPQIMDIGPAELPGPLAGPQPLAKAAE